MSDTKITTLGVLKKSGYQSKTIKEELRANLIQKLQNKEEVFPGIIGFDDTVIPDLQRAILSRHNMLLLGLRGQAKTRIARLLTHLLDDHIPYITGSEIHDDPLNPISKFGIDTVADKGDSTPISWLSREERYVEKLATPDVSVADLIGDVDPIKAASLKLPYSDQRVIHFGLVPRSHRCIFVINELPDLQARIQVSLFNMLQEGDLQIRGFQMRLPLDIQFVFTANPEDYTNRGSIVTPLKDRIESQILTHYPKTIAIAKSITQQEAQLTESQRQSVHVPEILKDLLENVAFHARESEYIDEKSGVSARLSISAYENLVSTAERRMHINGDDHTTARITDFWGVIPSITGKVELVYEGEQEGPYMVAIKLLNKALKDLFQDHFVNPGQYDDSKDKDPYGVVKMWFSAGNKLDLLNDYSNQQYHDALANVAGLDELVDILQIEHEERNVYKELVLNGLCVLEVLSKDILETSQSFSDPFSDMMGDLGDLGLA